MRTTNTNSESNAPISTAVSTNTTNSSGLDDLRADNDTDAGPDKYTADTLSNNNGGGLVSCVDVDETSLDVYQLTSLGDNPITRRALLLPDKPETLEGSRIQRTTMDGEEIDFCPYTNSISNWGCRGHDYGCTKCDAFAARKFLLCPTKEELELNPDAQPKTVPFCATCGYWLMGGKVPDGDKDGYAPVVYPPVRRGERVMFETFRLGSAVPTKWICRGGNLEIFEEGTLDGGLNNINFAKKLGDIQQMSQGLKVADDNGVYNTASHGVHRESPHLSSSPYDGGPPPGQPGYESNWPETREKLEAAHPPFGEVFKEIEECNDCKIFDGHITHSLLVKMVGSTAAKTIIGYFHPHGDKPFHGKTEKRGVLSSGRPVGKERKIMRINDREYGRWVDIEIDHGTLIEMDLFYSGASSGRYTHSIRDADGTYAIVLDYGKREIV